MVRYSQILSQNKREIILLKGYSCQWGRCTFCDYILDNANSERDMLRVNSEVMRNVTGVHGALEVINSGSVFELPPSTLAALKELVAKRGIRKLYFESYYGYKDRLQEIRDYFRTEIIFKCGIETFDHAFRNHVLKKGIVFDHPSEVAKYFESICLLVGVKGQTREMISKDIETLLEYFSYGCINLYTNNTTDIKADEALKQWFVETYSHLNTYPNIDVLGENTAFGVGGDAI